MNSSFSQKNNRLFLRSVKKVQKNFLFQYATLMYSNLIFFSNFFIKLNRRNIIIRLNVKFYGLSEYIFNINKVVLVFDFKYEKNLILLHVSKQTFCFLCIFFTQTQNFTVFYIYSALPQDEQTLS